MRIARLLDPRPFTTPLVVTPEQVGGSPAWQDLLRHGALTPMSDDGPAGTGPAVAVPAGTRIRPVHRALALAVLNGGALPVRAVLAGASAAWVYTGLRDGAPVQRLSADDRLELAHDPAVHRPGLPPGAVLRTAPGLRGTTTDLGGVPVTTPARTAADVACRLPFEHAVPVLVALAAGGPDRAPVDLARVEAALESRRRVVGRPAARRALTAARPGLRPAASAG